MLQKNHIAAALGLCINQYNHYISIMAFPPHALAEIRRRLPLSKVVGRVVKLTRRGHEHVGLCPFHQEKSPSFTVVDEKEFYHCFGCGANGDHFKFVQEYSKLSFVEAVERMAAEAGVALPQNNAVDDGSSQRRVSILKVLQAASNYFMAQLAGKEGTVARDYLTKRGVDAATQKQFMLGYAPDRYDGLAEALGVKPELLQQAGLRSRGERPADLFRGRLIFPILDTQQRVVAFGGRILQAERQPKYLNSPETLVFKKGGMLYGLTNARTAARDSKRLVVVEGYMDVIALYQAGVQEAVAPLGTAITPEQLETAWRYAPRVVICLDGDAAGQRAAAKVIERALPLVQAGRELYFLPLPAEHDPDTYIRQHGTPAWSDLMAQAQPLYRALLASLSLQHDRRTPESRAAFQRDLKKMLAVIPDVDLRRDYWRTIEGELRPAATPSPTWRAGAGRAPLTTGNSRTPLPQTVGRRQQSAILLALIRHPEVLQNVTEPLGHVAFNDADLDKLRNYLLTLSISYINAGAGQHAPMIEDLTRAGYGSLLTEMTHDPLVACIAATKPHADTTVVQTWVEEMLQALRLKDEVNPLVEATRRDDLSAEEWQETARHFFVNADTTES